MKKSVRLLLATVVLTVACVSPIFATETTLPAEKNLITQNDANVRKAVSTLVKFDENCGSEAKLAMHTIVDTAQSDVVKSRISEQQNFIVYLNNVVANDLEAERIKKGNVAALTDVVKVNPGFQPQLDAAIAEYNNAVAKRMADQAAIGTAQAELNALHIQLLSEVSAIGLTDADTIR